jgi:hypothetical protein
VFVHNPKVAGTSFRNMLCKNFECEDRRFNARVDGVCQDQAHLRVDQWPSSLWDLYIQGYYFFGMVRDPRDRFLSSMSEFWYQHQDMAQQLGTTRENLLRVMLTPNSIAYDVRFIHFTEQWRFFDYEPVGDSDQNLDIDIFRFEDMEHWVNSPNFKDKLKFNGRLELQNDRPSYYRAKEFPEELESMIPFLYKEDYDMFGYARKLPMQFLWHTHSHRLEFVHRYPEMVDIGKLNQREYNALQREKPVIESLSRMSLADYATRTTIIRRTANV